MVSTNFKMKHIQQTQLLILSIFLLYSCSKSISVRNIQNRHDLENQIVRDIKIPFKNFDTLILDASPPMLCGTPPPSKEFLNTIYQPQTDSIIYLNELKRKLKKQIIIIGKESAEEKQAKSEKTFVNLATSRKEYENYLKNKVLMKMEATVINNDTVQVYEIHQHFDSLITIEKLFVYNNGVWFSKIIKQNQLMRNNK
jgi:hypothetical protein